MKILLLALLFLFSFLIVRAQQSPQKTKTVSLPNGRQVSGMVVDTLQKPIIGAIVYLKSSKDSVKTTTDADGLFIFNGIKDPVFLLSISGLSIETITRKYLYNESAQKIVLDPIELKQEVQVLKEVVINGTPTIKYKKDTVEFRASDYKVPPNATVDQLLKKMEGMEVGSDGSLTFQGQAISKAKLNGKDFAGGNVAQAIQNLPAEIMEKAQIVDDYGDIAARTGIKNGPMQKILNLTTKTDRSIGTYGTFNGQAGNNSRYDVKLLLLHLNGNKELNFIGKLNDFVNGISTNAYGARNGTPGVTKSGTPSLTYRDEWGKNAKVVGNYVYNFFNNTSDNKSFGQNYSFGENDTIKNTSNFKSESQVNRTGKSHRATFQIDYDLGKFDFIQIKPSIAFLNSEDRLNSNTDAINHYITGFEHPVVKSIIHNKNSSNNSTAQLSYQHIFQKPKRTFSINFSYNHSNSTSSGDVFTDYNYFADGTTNHSLKDSIAHLFTIRKNYSHDVYSDVNYGEPLGKNSQLQLTSSISRSVNNTNAVSDSIYTDSLTGNSAVRQLTRLDNIFAYSFTEARIGINYNYETSKITFSAGAEAVPTQLKGEKIDNNTGVNITTPTHSDFRLIPIFRFGYSFSQTERITAAYSGTNLAPDFQAIQPFTDRSDPNNIIIGNPNLKPAFTNNITLTYNRYFSNAKTTIGFNINASKISNQTVTNILQRPELIASAPDRYKTVNEDHFVNLSGAKSMLGNYNISKQLDDRRYYITLNGSVTYSYNLAMSNDVLYHTTAWRLNERLGMSFTPNENVYINPYIAYDDYRTFTTLAGAAATSIKTTSMALDGKIYFFKRWNVNYTASKSFVRGLQAFDRNPLVINAGFERDFLQKKNLIFTFNVFDLLHQNDFIQQTVTAQGVTNTYSNTMSRYFLVGVKFIFQKWSGAPSRNGKQLKRKGDGSFINN